jgi:hypothetical protein
MEIGTLSASLTASYPPRLTQGGSTAEQARQTPRDATEIARRQENTLGGTAKVLATNDAEGLRKAARESVETRKAEASPPSTSPRVQFKDSEGTRVMEVYDSKNILIYQMPPKGTLTLIRNQENQPSPQVETTA